MDSIRLRRIQPEDAKLLFSWRNDGETRQQSRHTGPITWSEHEKWFTHALTNPASIVVIAHNEKGDAIGTVRGDTLEDGSVEISYTIAPEFRGKKLSKPMVLLFRDEYLKGKRIVAHIKKGHIPSESVARSLELSPVSETESEDPSDARPMVEWR